MKPWFSAGRKTPATRANSAVAARNPPRMPGTAPTPAGGTGLPSGSAGCLESRAFGVMRRGSEGRAMRSLGVGARQASLRGGLFQAQAAPAAGLLPPGRLCLRVRRRNSTIFKPVIHGAKLCVVLPAFNAARTLVRTLEALDRAIVDEVIVVDDASTDETREITRRLGVHYAFHRSNLGYGGNQKTCYALALGTGADIVVMVHPDYQYEPRLVPALSYMVASGIYDVAIASRILGLGAITGGMPRYKYVANRFLTFAQNVMIGQKLSEYHSGFRAF